MDPFDTANLTPLDDTDAIKRARDEVSPEALQATHDLLASFQLPRSRRWLMRGALAGVGAATLASATALTGVPVFAAAKGDTVKDIFSLAATAESLAVTFYNNGIANAHKLRLSWAARAALKSIAREEDIHRSFFIANGGTPATGTFSFPAGDNTFQHKQVFFETQQQLEVVFDSAFFLAVKVFADMSGGATLAQIAAQIAAVEQGHLAVGRYIAGFVPAEPYVFAPVLFSELDQIVPAVKAAGYLSPTAGNSFSYSHAEEAFVVDTEPDDKTVLNATPSRRD